MWATYIGLGGGKVGTRSRICPKGWMVWVACNVRHMWGIPGRSLIWRQLNPIFFEPFAAEVRAGEHSQWRVPSLPIIF